MKKLFVILLTLTALTGCLEKEVTHTLYVEADGSVTWTVLEDEVYSSAEKEQDRRTEEESYLRDAMAGSPEILAALAEIGGSDLRSILLRADRPFSLRATARFDSLEQALRGLVEVGELDAELRFDSFDGRNTLTIESIAESGDDAVDNSSIEEFFRAESFRFVLAQGRFEESPGFELQDDGRVAVWSIATEDRAAEMGVRRLVWFSGH